MDFTKDNPPATAGKPATAFELAAAPVEAASFIVPAADPATQTLIAWMNACPIARVVADCTVAVDTLFSFLKGRT
jgi:hypothetical protein